MYEVPGHLDFIWFGQVFKYVWYRLPYFSVPLLSQVAKLRHRPTLPECERVKATQLASAAQRALQSFREEPSGPDFAPEFGWQATFEYAVHSNRSDSSRRALISVALN